MTEMKKESLDDNEGIWVALKIIGLGTTVAVAGVAVFLLLCFGMVYVVSAAWHMGGP